MSATLLPMLVPPQPWTSVTEGGYFVSPCKYGRQYCVSMYTNFYTHTHTYTCTHAHTLARTHTHIPIPFDCPFCLSTNELTIRLYTIHVASVVRCPPDTYQHHLLLKEADNLNAVLDALNFLGSAPWRVNTGVGIFTV